jgi:hypothetical protein
MHDRQDADKKGSENSASGPKVKSQFQSRPFALPAQSEEASLSQQETPDLQTQLDRARRLGPNLSRVKVKAQPSGGIQRQPLGWTIQRQDQQVAQIGPPQPLGWTIQRQDQQVAQIGPPQPLGWTIQRQDQQVAQIGPPKPLGWTIQRQDQQVAQIGPPQPLGWTIQRQDQQFQPATKETTPTKPPMAEETTLTKNTTQTDTQAGTSNGRTTDVDEQEVEPGVVAKEQTADGHQLKVLTDGTIVRCSVCQPLETRYEHLFKRKSEYGSEVRKQIDDLEATVKKIRELQQQENTNKADHDAQLANLKEELRAIEDNEYTGLKQKEREAIERFETLKERKKTEAQDSDEVTDTPEEKGDVKLAQRDLIRLREIQQARLEELMNSLGITPTKEQLRGMIGYAKNSHQLPPETIRSLVKNLEGWNQIKQKFVEYPPLMRQIIAERIRVVDRNYREAIKDIYQNPENFTNEPEMIKMLKTDEGKARLKEVKLLPIGSKDLTSDYDATVVGKPGDGALEILAVIAFNKRFQQDWGRESGTVFDTNVYTTGHMPASSLSNQGQQYSSRSALAGHVKDIQTLEQKLEEIRAPERTTIKDEKQRRDMEQQIRKLIRDKKNDIKEAVSKINNLRKASGEKRLTTEEVIKQLDADLDSNKTDLKKQIQQEEGSGNVGVKKETRRIIAKNEEIMSLVKMRRFMTEEQWRDYSQSMRDRGADSSLFEQADSIYKTLQGELDTRKSTLPDTVKDPENYASNRLYEEKLGELIPRLQELKQLREKYKGLKQKDIPGDKLARVQVLNIEVNQIQSEALFFANEAYHTGGPVEHVVLNQQMRLDLDVNAQKLSHSVNEQTGFIMEQTEHVSTDDPKGFGKSLWKSAKYLDRICNAAEKLEYIMTSTQMAVNNKTIEDIPDGELKKVYQMRDAAAELLKIKKNAVMDDKTKSQKALKIVEKIGLNNVKDYQQRVLELNAILNQRVPARTKKGKG